jgi:hypothetical protein
MPRSRYYWGIRDIFHPPGRRSCRWNPVSTSLTLLGGGRRGDSWPALTPQPQENCTSCTHTALTVPSHSDISPSPKCPYLRRLQSGSHLSHTRLPVCDTHTFGIKQAWVQTLPQLSASWVTVLTCKMEVILILAQPRWGSDENSVTNILVDEALCRWCTHAGYFCFKPFSGTSKAGPGLLLHLLLQCWGPTQC